MSPIYRSQVPRCWEVTGLEPTTEHFFAFGLRSKGDEILVYGIISETPEKGVITGKEAIEFETDAALRQKHPLPRSLCRLILTGKPLIESVIARQAKGKKLKAQRDQALSSVAEGQSDLVKHLQQELWFNDDYIDRLYDAIAHLYRQVVAESELIQFDGTEASDAHLREADLRAEHVEQLLDELEKDNGNQKKWSFPKMFNRSL